MTDLHLHYYPAEEVEDIGDSFCQLHREDHTAITQWGEDKHGIVIKITELLELILIRASRSEDTA